VKQINTNDTVFSGKSSAVDTRFVAPTEYEQALNYCLTRDVPIEEIKQILEMLGFMPYEHMYRMPTKGERDAKPGVANTNGVILAARPEAFNEYVERHFGDI
jgi:hypothetical protein